MNRCQLRSLSARALACAAICIPAVAQAAGLEAPENGAEVLARGGTAVAVTGTAYGVEFNPATLADVPFLDVHVDMRLVSNSVSFTRAPLTGQGTTFSPVSNSAGIFASPGVYVAFHPKNLPLGFGVGVFGPPGVGIYTFPDPRKLVQNLSYADADAASGQRYSLIANNALILLPTISVSWKIVDWVSIGLSIQEARAEINTSQAVASASLGGMESVDSDAYATVSASGFSLPIFVPGVLFQPVRGLTIGGQFRPGFQLKLNGTVDVTAITPDIETKICMGASSVCPAGSTNRIGLALNQPAEARFGIGYEIGRFNITGEGVYEGWSAYKDIILNGANVNVETVNGDQTKLVNLGTQTQVKNWKDAWSGRLGASYRILTERDNGFGLKVSLGGLYETNAIPPAYQGIDTVTGNRMGGSVGLTGSFHGLGLTFGLMGYLPVQLNVTNSVVDRGVSGLVGTDPNPVIIGNGTYNAGLWIAAIGLSYSG